MTLAHGFGGIVPPLVTPMTEEFEIDTDSLQSLIKSQLAAGVQGIFVLGSTGEAVHLTDRQRATVIEVSVRTVAGRVPVLAGLIDTTTARVLEHAAVAQRAGVDAVVLPAPFYARINQAEIIEHFRAVHAAIDVPIIAYNIPVSVHIKIELPTLLQLFKERLIVGVKDSSGDEVNFRSTVLAKQQYPDFLVFSGQQVVVDLIFWMGADGAVPGLGNVDPAGYQRLYQAITAGNVSQARQEQERLIRLYTITRVAQQRLSPHAAAFGGLKTALQLLGIINTNVMGRPLQRFNADEVEQVRQILVENQLL